MKTFCILLLVAALHISQAADLQTSSDIKVLKATYGTENQQMDVTAKVDSLVQIGQLNVHVGNHLFGKDPSFGKKKTLTVLFTSNGVEYRTEIEEGHPLSFANAHPVNVVENATAPTVQQQPSSSSSPASAPPEPIAPANHRLAPEGTLYLIKYYGVKKVSGVIGVLPGTRLKLVKDLGETMKVKTADEYRIEFEVDSDKLTNDIDLAEWAKRNDEQSQKSLNDYMKQARDNYVADQQKFNPLYAQQAEDAENREKERSTVGGRSTKLDRGAYDQHYSDPWWWWYHGRPFIYRVHR